MAGSGVPQSHPSTPARVVCLLEELNFGGTQRQTLELARGLDRRRFQAEIWLLRAGAGLAPLARQWGIPVHWLAQTSGVGPASLANLWRRLRREPIDLLLTLTAIPNIWGRLAGRAAGQGGLIGNVRSNTAHRQHEWLLWRLAAKIVCNNQALATFLEQAYRIPAARLALIPNGVDTEFFQPRPGGGEPERLRVLSIGRLVPDKDHETLLRAFGLVLAEHPGVELWLVGDGPRQAYLQGLMAQIIPEGRARLIPGQVDIRPFLSRASLFVLSSVTEALPNVVLEAMAASLPVVATAVGGLPEVVVPDETGLLVPPRQPGALAGAMGRLLAQAPLRRRLGQGGRRRVVEEYSLRRMVERYEALFTELLAQKPER